MAALSLALLDNSRRHVFMFSTVFYRTESANDTQWNFNFIYIYLQKFHLIVFILYLLFLPMSLFFFQ